MTARHDAAVGESGVAPAAPGLVMVGPSGAVCVDGVCAIEPRAEANAEGSRDAS